MSKTRSKMLVYLFDRKFDRFRGEKKKNIRLVDKMSVINEAQMIYFERKASEIEVDSQITGTLSGFIVREKKLTPSSIGNRAKNFKLPSNHYKTIRSYCKLSKDSCGSKFIPITHARSDKIDGMLISPFWKPSFRWEMVLGNRTDDSISIYVPEDVNIDGVFIDYLKMPSEIHAPSMSSVGSYEDWNGIVRTRDVNCDFNEYDANKIVDIAVLISRSDMGDLRDLNTQLKTLFTDFERSPKI